MNIDNYTIKDSMIESLSKILESLKESPEKTLSEFNHASTLLLHIDIVEGFLNQGALSSEKVQLILPHVLRYNEGLDQVQKVFILDDHPEDAVEFKAYPPHCVRGTGENELVSELVPFTKDAMVFRKNSTNLFHAKGFVDYLKAQEKQLKQVLILGDVTDICVLQGALSLKTYFDEHQLDIPLYVILKGVETFDLEATFHHGELMNLFSLYNMRQNGIQLIKDLI